MYFVLCIIVFVIAYLLNALTISIGYHRGLAHGAVDLGPRFRAAVIASGNWITGLDPKAWVVMHRMHHEYSDTEEDPHSPENVGILGIGMEQLRSYERVLRGLGRNDAKYTKHAYGLDFPLSRLNQKRQWWMPYALHALIGLALAVSIGWVLGLAYFAGMMSHPIQGGMVNAFGHAMGGRNFDTDDHSRNNLFVAWTVLGEGLQNNHHRYPRSAKFSYRWWEPDLGFVFCRVFQALGFIAIDVEELIPTPRAYASEQANEQPA